MAYSGYLIKVGSYTIPYKYIKFNSYVVTLHGQDSEAYNDANGMLQRDALADAWVAKVEINTPVINDTQVNDLFSNIRLQYINTTERRLHASIFIPELNNYIEQDVYMPDPTFTIRSATSEHIVYDELRLAFIGYGGSTNG